MTPRTPATRTAPADVEAAILDAAAHLLEQEGPHALTIRRIASAAGVAPMTIYNRFDGKGGVLDALFTRGFDRLAVIAGSVDPSAPEPVRDQLRASADAYRAFALEDPGTYALMFDRPVVDFEASPAALEAAGHAFARLVDSVAAVQAAGTIVDGDAVDVAQRLWATMHGAVSLERRGICFAADPDRHYAGLMDTLLLGLDPEAGIPGSGGRPPGASGSPV